MQYFKLNASQFRFVYRPADNSALSHSLDSAEIYISCSVHKYKWHSRKRIFQIYLVCIFVGFSLFDDTTHHVHEHKMHQKTSQGTQGPVGLQ